MMILQGVDIQYHAVGYAVPTTPQKGVYARGGGRLQLVLMRHPPPPCYTSKLGGEVLLGVARGGGGGGCSCGVSWGFWLGVRRASIQG